MKLEQYLDVIISFLKDYLNDSHMDGYVLGLSGGVDSSLVAALSKKAIGKEKLTCIMMPIDSHPDDLKDAKELAKALDLNYVVLDASEAFHNIKDMFIKAGIELDTASLSNLKVRLRMSMLYAYGQKHRYLVLGTDNMDERYTGYFTKYGDGAADILPIVYLTKGEVVKASKLLGVPTRLAERVPSAGLFEGQTDEKEMGVKYSDLDNFLLGNKVDPKVEERILHLHKISEHKRKAIPTPPEFKR
ncbi:MAG: NAD(+) synthase [Bacilli bacterium]|nr:NAD(+) synthase [Bacilli bacterium]